jgi:hypothetical protein
LIAHDVKIGHREVNGKIERPDFQSSSNGDFYAVGFGEKTGKYIVILELEDPEVVKRIQKAIHGE